MESVDGFWWDPEHPETRWPGTLNYGGPEGANLKLLLEPVPLSASLLRKVFSNEIREYDLLLGDSTSGEKVTLLKAFNRSTDTVFANAVIIGFHAVGADPLISTAAVVFRHLDEWWDRAAISPDVSLGWPNLTLQYREPDPIVVYEDSVLRISVRSGLTGSHKRMEHSLKEEIRIEMSAISPIPLSEFQWRVDACKDLLSVACHTVCEVEELRLIPPRIDGESRLEIGRFHAVPILSDRDQESRMSPDPLFHCGDIRDHTQEIFTAWLQCARSLLVVRSLYLSAVYGKAFLEVKLLHLTQAAEAYHRRCYDGLYMDGLGYGTRVADVLTDAIPTGLDPSLRDSLKNRVKYGNEYSFVKRLTILVREHEDALMAVAPNPLKWVKTISDRRNSFTHHPVTDGQFHTIDRKEIICCNYMLQTLLEFCLLKSMGMASAQITTLAAGCARYGRIKRRFFADQ
ncbi:MAG TPA: HEPN domain-containing protein [Vicinamibacterales bacterium]|nr:HEPN domain-containing protein [Vicinamibacterales bacterium]